MVGRSILGSENSKGPVAGVEPECSRNKEEASVAGAKLVSSVAQLCPTLCEPMDCRKPGFPVHHQLPEITQTHVH